MTRAGSAPDRLALARKLDARVRQLVSRSNRTEALVAGLLHTIARHGLDRALGWKNLNAYARSVADWDATKTSRMVTLVGDLRNLPEMRRAFFTGELPWTKACIGAAAAVQKPGTDALWTERVRTLGRDALEQLRREEANEPAQYKVVLMLTPEQKASLDDAVVALRRESDEALDVSAVVAEVCRRVVQGGAGAAGPRPLVALGVCSECETMTHGSATVTAAEAPALCNSEIVDFTVEPPARRRSISPRIAAQVLARDQGRCRVPGCDNRTWLELHHEGGWRAVGHDPGKILTICASHHQARHDELLRIVFDAGRATFTLADGEILGEVDLRVLRRKDPSPRRSPSFARAQETASDAKKALVSLGFGVNEAERAIAAVGELPTAELLIKSALRRASTRGAVATPTPGVLSTRSSSA